jgi:hypothetical protein
MGPCVRRDDVSAPHERRDMQTATTVNNLSQVKGRHTRNFARDSR